MACDVLHPHCRPLSLLSCGLYPCLLSWFPCKYTTHPKAGPKFCVLRIAHVQPIQENSQRQLPAASFTSESGFSPGIPWRWSQLVNIFSRKYKWIAKPQELRSWDSFYSQILWVQDWRRIDDNYILKNFMAHNRGMPVVGDEEERKCKINKWLWLVASSSSLLALNVHIVDCK